MKTVKFFSKFGVLLLAGMIISAFGSSHEKSFTTADIKKALAPNQASAEVPEVAIGCGGGCSCGGGCCGCGCGGG